MKSLGLPKAKGLKKLPLLAKVEGKFQRFGYASLVRSELDRVYGYNLLDKQNAACHEIGERLGVKVTLSQFLVGFEYFDIEKTNLVVGGKNNPSLDALKKQHRETVRYEQDRRKIVASSE